MKNIFVSRSEIIKVLNAWQNDEVTAREVWDWASERYFPGETNFDDLEGDSSVANEVLCELDCLDMNLVIQEDVPIHIEFLETPKGQFEFGFQRWRKKVDLIDFKKRCEKLRTHDIYGPFCK